MFDGKVPTSKSYISNRRGGDTANRNRGNFVERARAERDARAQEKLRQKSATVIQAAARCRGFRAATFMALKQEFDSSMQNIVKMGSILSAAGKKFAVPPAVMLKLLRIVAVSLDVKDADNLHRLNAMFELTMDYVTSDQAKVEITKADVHSSWLHLLGKLFKFAFSMIKASVEQGQKNQDVVGKPTQLVRIISEVSNLLCTSTGSAVHPLLRMATIFFQEECSCLRMCMQHQSSGIASMLMPSMVDVLKRSLAVSKSAGSKPASVHGIWSAVTGAILSLPDLCTLPSSGELLAVLGTGDSSGWSICLDLLCHGDHTAASPTEVKKNVVANYFADPSSAQTDMAQAIRSPSASLLLLVNQILEPGGDPRGEMFSSSTESILGALANKDFAAYALRGALENAPVNSTVAVLSLYGRLLCICRKNELATQAVKDKTQAATLAILGSRIQYCSLNSGMWQFLSNSISLNVSSGGEEVLCSRLGAADGGTNKTLMLMMLLFCQFMWHELFTMDDEDFLRSECVIGRPQMEALVTLINKLLLRLYRLEIAGSIQSVLHRELHKHATKLYNQIFKIDDRRHFFTDSTIWQWAAILEQDLVLDDSRGREDALYGMLQNPAGPAPHGRMAIAEEDEINEESMEVDSQGEEGDTLLGHPRGTARSPLKNPITWRALKAHPQVLSFSRRVVIFQDLLEHDKAEQMSGARSMDSWGMGGVSVDIDRNDVVRCAFRKINGLNSDDLKGRLKVQFISKQGYAEAGIDGGGLFKEFMDDLVSNLFSEDLGIFNATEEQLLVPNPAALDVERLQLFRFAGKMLGKALYENLLVDPQFSGVFLNVLLHRSNHFDDLGMLDQQMYGSLRQLKHMDAASVAALGLTFEAQRSGDGQITTHELVPGGSQLPVTADNKINYLFELANFKLNREFKRASDHFNAGLHELIPEDWIRLFSPRELQQLISGQKKGIDIDDMKRNVGYAGGYAESQPYVQAFWRIVSEMNLDQQGDLLKFITSCSRQPLRGFSQLTHRMCIQRVPQYSQDQFESTSTSVLTARLPSAATCVNLLKLPEYDNAETLKEKLLYAVSHNTGFELS